MDEKHDHPHHDNDNARLKPDWMTEAEYMQRVKNEQARVRRAFLSDFRLRADPEKRLWWEELKAMEECGLYHFYRRP